MKILLRKNLAELVMLMIVCLSFSNLDGQQLPIFNHYSDNISTINPAFISTNYSIDGYDMNFSLTHRAQWLGIEGSPNTQNFATEFVFDKRNLILGGHILNDQAGPLRQTGVYGKAGVYFAGRNLEDGAFSGALSFGYNQYGINGDEISFRDSEPTIVSQNILYPDIGLGLAFFKRIQYGNLQGDILYGGFSMPQIFNLQNTVAAVDGPGYSITRARHMYLNLGYTKYYDNNTYLELSSWLKNVTGTKLHSDINLKYKMNDSFWLGCGISTKRALQVNAGIAFYDVLGSDSSMRIAYTFTEYYNTNSVYFGNSHEITIGFSRTREKRKYGF